MSTLEQRVETLQRRVAALEAENTSLRQQSPSLPAPEQQASRRQMLVGGAGVLGALAGGSLLARAQPAAAAPARGAAAHAQEAAVVRPEALRVTLTPLTSRGVFWAQHDWQLGAHFSGAEAPVVLATAADDYMEHDVTASCNCSVRVSGTPGAYVATIMVRGIHSHARSVEVHAVAISR